MAFVLGKAEKTSLFDLKEQHISVPGPGAYNSNTGKKQLQYCAPFNTSQAKISSFEVEQKKYGPGSYEPKYPKDISKAQSQGYVFTSKVERFTTEKDNEKKSKKQSNKLQISQVNSENMNVQTNNTASPTSDNRNKDIYYQRLEKSKSIMDEIRIRNQENRIESIKGKREFIRVLLTSTHNSQHIQSKYVYKNIQGKTLGPGSYQNINFQPKSKGVSKWELSKIERFKTEPNIVPGPGTYVKSEPNDLSQLSDDENRTKSKQKRLSAAFASTVIRSHMDTLIYRTNIPIKASILQDRRFKDSRPGPGSYNPNKVQSMKKDFNYGCDTSFGYGDRNQKDTKDKDWKLGPGVYEVNEGTIMNHTKGKRQNKIIKEIRNQIFGKRGRIGTNHNKNNSLTQSYLMKGAQKGIQKDEVEETKPERSESQKRLAKYCSLEERCFSKLGNMNQEERFKAEKNIIADRPGPGEYYNDTDSDFRISQWKKGTSVFMSSTGRDTFSHKLINTQTPFYNIIKNDIGFKAEKMKRYIENLKRINIQKTPFQTSSKRFNENEAHINMLVHEFEEGKRRIYSETKPEKPSCAFKSSTKRDVFKSENKPGPGDYSSKMRSNGGYESVEKRSFNKYYNSNTGTHKNEEKMSNKDFYRKNSKIEDKSQKGKKNEAQKPSQNQIKIQNLEPAITTK